MLTSYSDLYDMDKKLFNLRISLIDLPHLCRLQFVLLCESINFQLKVLKGIK